MGQSMKAFVMKKIGLVGTTDKPVPVPGPNDAIVKTAAPLACASDIRTVAGAIGERANVALGHEAVGGIYTLGGAVKGFREGERVAVNAITPCYRCENCLRGDTSQCTGCLVGWSLRACMKEGTLAEYVHGNSAQANLAPIPASLTDGQAASCTDMMSTGFVGAEHARIPIVGSVAVFAQGPLGLMATVGGPVARGWPGHRTGNSPAAEETGERVRGRYRDRLQGTGSGQSHSECDGRARRECVHRSPGGSRNLWACVKPTRQGGTISNAGYIDHGEYVQTPRKEWGVGMGR